MRQTLQEMNVGLDGMILITAYRAPRSHINTSGLVTVHEEELGLGLSDHEDYVSTVAPFSQMLNGWVLPDL
jgi:hypothetical protein